MRGRVSTATRSSRCRAIAACAALLSALCASGHAAEIAPANAGRLVISGSTTMAPLVSAIGKRFAAAHPGVTVEVRSVTSAVGIADLMAGKADIGMVSRVLTDNESGLYAYAIARDGICLVVHNDNPVRALTNRQVLELYTGRIDNWSKVGGKDARVALLNASQGVGAAELFTHFYGIRYADIKARSVLRSNEERVNAIAAEPNGIVYMSLGAAHQAVLAGVPIRLLPVDGVAATTKNIRTGNFPISRPLLLITNGLPTRLAKEFINFSLSSQITDIVLQHEFVPYLD
jgi:phosphate transport system substrate-binding protein